MTVERMGEGHISAVAEIEKECFSSPWSEEGLRSELTNDGAYFFVATQADALLGYGGMHITLDEGYIANIAVTDTARKKGVASAVLTRLIATAKEKGCAFLSLEVRKSNTPAIALYEKFGFEMVGERKNFYTSPTENAIIMTLYF